MAAAVEGEADGRWAGKLLPPPPISAAATCNTASQVLMYASPNSLDPKTPDAAKNDVLNDDQVDSNANANGSDALPAVLVDNGNGEAKLNSFHASPEPAECPDGPRTQS